MVFRTRAWPAVCALAAAGMILTGCNIPDAPTARMSVTFSDVVAQVMPVAERQCRDQTPRIKCNFDVELLHDPDLHANAYYQRLPSGQPRIVVTSALLRTVRNADELALILGHEAGHHIAGHFEARSENALAAALASWIAAEESGLRGADLSAAAQAGAVSGAHQFSKQFELEADRLGAAIARQAGYEPARGIAYLSRAQGPGARTAGTHPANARRIQQVLGPENTH